MVGRLAYCSPATAALRSAVTFVVHINQIHRVSLYAFASRGRRLRLYYRARMVPMALLHSLHAVTRFLTSRSKHTLFNTLKIAGRFKGPSTRATIPIVCGLGRRASGVPRLDLDS